MVLVAVLLLPLMSVLLLVMDRLEDRVSDPARVRGRHAGHRRHLRLIPGSRRNAGADAGPFESGQVEGSSVEGSSQERRRAA
ncbi:hypothetical protein ACH4UM_32530 [Streptomyces sp. NPDC020801]|uniref:hypothetical protein n=1 Tax=unclassified Streptomyces TaxID=2593676 RepID=UPI0037A0A1B0